MRKIDKILLALLLLVAVTLTMAIFWLVYPYKTADIVEPIKVLNPNHQIAPGEKIVMELKITKYHLYPVENDNSIVCDNGQLYVMNQTMPKGKSSLPVGTFTRIQNAYSLPNAAEIGTKCHFDFQNSYKVNPIRSIIKHWQSETFTVT